MYMEYIMTDNNKTDLDNKTNNNKESNMNTITITETLVNTQTEAVQAALMGFLGETLEVGDYVDLGGTMPETKNETNETNETKEDTMSETETLIAALVKNRKNTRAVMAARIVALERTIELLAKPKAKPAGDELLRFFTKIGWRQTLSQKQVAWMTRPRDTNRWTVLGAIVLKKVEGRTWAVSWKKDFYKSGVFTSDNRKHIDVLKEIMNEWQVCADRAGLRTNRTSVGLNITF